MLYTVDREIFADKYFARLNFHVVLFLLLWPLDETNLHVLYLLVEENI